MSIADLGILAVIACNLLFVALCTYMAWRMLSHMRDSQTDLSAYADSLKAHAGRLNRTADETLGTFSDVKRELARLIEMARSGVVSGDRTPSPRPSPEASSQRLSELSSQLAEAQADRQRLRRQLDHLQASMKRTLTEKAFIEDRFMQLDSQRPAERETAEAGVAG